ncbi:MAG TPA: GNAT family N-acetyltransferase [Candidatus Woesebacteria bacterium]|nr:GNAT family N-acetyltransferase [Candidatus Woesebacteria bacterium]
MDITCRIPTVDEIGQLADIIGEFEKDNLAKNYFSDQPSTNTELVSYATDFINSESKRAFVAIANKRIVGFVLCILFTEDQHLEIIDLYIQPEFRKLGIGQKLLQSVELIATKLDFLIKVEVYEKNNPAITFYQKLGYENDGVVLIKKISSHTV